jgi:hypothetical protein
VSVDHESGHEWRPNARELVKRAGFERIVELHVDPISYTWHLKRNLARYSEEPFDFVFIDGAHNWDTDGFAFFLVDRVLKPGGWVLFDDLNWTYASSPALSDSPLVRDMSEEAKLTPQIRDVWEMLVLPHPAYGHFLEDNGWGWAQKSPTASPSVKHLDIVRRPPRWFLRKIKRNLFRLVARANGRSEIGMSADVAPALLFDRPRHSLTS